MIFDKISKIDKLVRKKAKHIAERQKTIDDRDETMADIENKIEGLQNKAFQYKQVSDSKIAEFDRLIKKDQDEIELEARYYSSVAKEVKNTKLSTDVFANKTKNNRGV